MAFLSLSHVHSGSRSYAMFRPSLSTRLSGVLCLLFCLSIILPTSQARAEGFAIMENSARGMGLAGGLIARGGDASTTTLLP